MRGKVREITRNIQGSEDMTNVLPFVTTAILACVLGATASKAQTSILSNSWTGELVRLNKADSCGPYFQDAGNHVLFSIADNFIAGGLVRPVFVMSKRNIAVIADDAQKVPHAWLSFNLTTGRPAVVIKASVLDIQDAKCLGVIKNE